MTEMEVNDEECWQSVKDGAFPRGVLFVCPWYVPYMCEEEPCIYWVLVRAEPMLNNTAPRTPLLLLPLTNDPQHTFVHKQKRVNTFTLNCSVQGNIQQSPTPMPYITCVYTHTHTHTHTSNAFRVMSSFSFHFQTRYLPLERIDNHSDKTYHSMKGKTKAPCFNDILMVLLWSSAISMHYHIFTRPNK